jgi:hypothetical protein
MSNFSACTAKLFPFMYSHKRFSQASLLISTNYFQNRIIMSCLELWYSGVLEAAIQLSAYIGIAYFQAELWNFSSTVQETHISILEQQRWSLEYVISFSKVYILFSNPNFEKLSSFVETFTPYNQILIFKEQLSMSTIDFYIWYGKSKKACLFARRNTNLFSII